MSSQNKLALVFFAALFVLCGVQPAHASQCVVPAFSGDWVVSGSAPSYPGPQVSYTLGAIRITERCVDAGTTKCWGEGDERVCSTTSAVRPIYMISVGEVIASFTGTPSTNYYPATDATAGGDGWYYADATVSGNLTRTWFRVQPDGNIQGVFEVWINGQYRNAEWRTFVRPRPPIKILPRPRPGLGF